MLHNNKKKHNPKQRDEYGRPVDFKKLVFELCVMNPVASAFPVACYGVSERMGNIIIPYGSKILRSLLRRASIGA
jgi:hypothetical protein